MKNIYIVGVPRSGKSTLSKMIKEKYPIYNQISFEAIRNGFIEALPKLNMDNRNSDGRKYILPKYITTFATWNYEIFDTPILIDGSFCPIDELAKLIDEDDLIICLGLGCRNIDEIVDGIKRNDKEEDYTSTWSSEQIKKHFYDIVDTDKLNYDYCLKNNIKYYDTYNNRTDVFNEIIQNL